MANPVCEVLWNDSDLERAGDWPGNSCGAIVDFQGVVRAKEGEREIRGIEYEAHPVMAEHQLRVLGEKAMGKFGLAMVVIRHRAGFVPVGKASLFARVAAPHRPEALQAMDWLVTELKRKVPIWKHPKFELEEGVERLARMQTGNALT